MPLPTNVPPVPPIKIIIPARQYPHLVNLVKELDFLCPTCTAATGNGIRVYKTFDEAVKHPISAPLIQGADAVSKKGMYATRMALLCPECRCVLGGDLVDNGIVDLLAIDPAYRKPDRSGTETSGEDISYDNEEPNAPAAVATLGRGKRAKKKSDLSPESRRAVNTLEQKKALAKKSLKSGAKVIRKALAENGVKPVAQQG